MLTDDELKDLADSAQQEALSFGLDAGLFLRYFKTVCKLAAEKAKAEPVWQPLPAAPTHPQHQGSER